MCAIRSSGEQRRGGNCVRADRNRATERGENAPFFLPFLVYRAMENDRTERERERRKETTSGGERKLTRRRRPVNLYPPFLFWPGCGSFAHGWGQDRPTGSRTLVDLAAGFGILLVSGIRVRVCTEVANGLRRSRVCATNEERGRRKRVSRRIPKERGRRKRRARVVVSLSLPPFLSFSRVDPATEEARPGKGRGRGSYRVGHARSLPSLGHLSLDCRRDPAMAHPTIQPPPLIFILPPRLSFLRDPLLAGRSLGSPLDSRSPVPPTHLQSSVT